MLTFAISIRCRILRCVSLVKSYMYIHVEHTFMTYNRAVFLFFKCCYPYRTHTCTLKNEFFTGVCRKKQMKPTTVKIVSKTIRLCTLTTHASNFTFSLERSVFSTIPNLVKCPMYPFFCKQAEYHS